MASCQLTVQAYFHQPPSLQQVYQNSPSRHGIVHMMENTHAFDDVKFLSKLTQI
jgi:hypothetical protein